MLSGDDPPLSRWARMTTGLKMLIIMSLGLLPLGVIAVFASIENASSNWEKAQNEAQALLAVHLQRFTLALSRNAFTMRSARDAMIETGQHEGVCRRTLDRLSRSPNTPGRFVVYGNGADTACVTAGFRPVIAAPEARGETARGAIGADGETLTIHLFDPDGAIEGIAEYRREALADVVDNPPTVGEYAVELVQEGRVMPLRSIGSRRSGGEEAAATFALANGQYEMRVRTPVTSVRPIEILIILTPILMWLWASLVGWVIVQWLLLRPLARVQNVISAYRPGDRGLDLPTVRSPAREIGALGESFARATETVARHEADLEAAVARQTRLVREVHHRVKNNLQVVASLLNLHSRGSDNEDVAAAYASIQRRVDALAVVHRNHYAELEENRGVALKPLVSELAANLRATAPAAAGAMQIRLAIAAVDVTQDTAVSVAFLITEVVEFAMLTGARMVSVAVDRESPGTARLAIEMDSPADAVVADENLRDRFDRIVTGLARQLRSTLAHDAERGRYSIEIATIEAPPG